MKLFFVLSLLVLTSCSQVQTRDVGPFPGSQSIEILKPSPARSDVFRTASSIKLIQDSVRVANCVVRSEDFLQEISRFPKYDFTTLSPGAVADAYRSIKPIQVSSYQTRNPFSKVLATTYSTDRETLYINTRKFPRSLPSVVNTIIHEAGHLINFSHGNNSSVGKENSVNYRVGSIAETHTQKCI